jgi:type III secretion protein J
MVAVALTGCKVELYADLSENDANEMLAILLTHGVPASKLPGKDTVSIRVDEADVAAAVEILNRKGYPRDRFTSLGEIFQKEGLISSPLEERVRYSYGLSQSISETLTNIDGVLTARVHVVLPDEQPLDEEPKPSSAAVFIRYQPGLGVEEAVPNIKMIVQNSVEQLSYDRISVALFPAKEDSKGTMSGPPIGSALGIRVAQDSMTRLMTTLGALATLLLVSLAGNGYLVWRMRGTNGPGETGAAGNPKHG